MSNAPRKVFITIRIVVVYGDTQFVGYIHATDSKQVLMFTHDCDCVDGANEAAHALIRQNGWVLG